MAENVELLPWPVMCFLDKASISERYEMGQRLIRENCRGLFGLTRMYYYDPKLLSCHHRNFFAPLFLALPRDWMDEQSTVRGSHERDRNEFNLFHADARCDDCKRLAVEYSHGCVGWEFQKMKEIGLFS